MNSKNRQSTLLQVLVLATAIYGSYCVELRAAPPNSPVVRVVASAPSAGIINIDGYGLAMNPSGLTTFRSESGRLWSELGQQLQVSAQQGQNAGTTAQFNAFEPALFNGTNTIAFFGWLQGAGVNVSNDQGIWTATPSGVNLVVRTGQQAAGLPTGVNYSSISRATLNSFRSVASNRGGAVSFKAAVLGPNIDPNLDEGIWRNDSRGLQLVAMEGRQAPHAAGNFLRVGVPALNNSADVTFHAVLDRTLNSDSAIAIYHETAGTLGIVAREGNVAPGAAGSKFYTGFSDPVLNDAGDVAFRSNIGRTSYYSQNDEGVWSQRAGQLQKVALTGEAAPGTSSKFYLPFSPPVIDSHGRTAFTANLTNLSQPNGSDFGLWSEGRTGSLELIARQGQQAPGLPAGFTFSGDFKEVAINSSGKVAFMGRVLPGSSNNEWGIWAQDENYNLRLIAMTGSTVEDSGLPGNIIAGTLTFVGGSGNQDGRRSGFNDLGQVAFVAGLTSGKYAGFVSNAVAVPEPPPSTLASVAAMTLATVSLISRRNRMSPWNGENSIPQQLGERP